MLFNPKSKTWLKFQGFRLTCQWMQENLLFRVLHARKWCDMLVIDVVSGEFFSHLIYKVGITGGDWRQKSCAHNFYLTNDFCNASEASRVLEETSMCALTHLSSAWFVFSCALSTKYSSILSKKNYTYTVE